DVGIDERGEDAAALGWHLTRDRDLHARPSARAIARSAFTHARCARNSGDAWMSPSASTPSAACDAARSIASGVGDRCAPSACSTALARYAFAATPVTPTRTPLAVTTAATPASAKPLAFCSVFT